MSTKAKRRPDAAHQGGFSRSGTLILVVGVLVVGGLLAVAVAGGLASGGAHPSSAGAPDGSSTTTSTTPQQVTTTTTLQQAMAQLLANVKMSPASGGTAPAGGMVTLRAQGARLDNVVLRAARATVAGTTSSSSATTSTLVPGKLATSGEVWHSTGVLLPSTSYTVHYEVSDQKGLTAHGSGTFRTAAPAYPVSVNIWPAPGISVGIGEPIELTFSRPLTAAQEAKVLTRVTIDMSKPVPGGWHWFSPTTVHFRPTHFWPVGEQVQASVNLSDLRLSTGKWGVGTYQSQFVVGPSHISIANLATHEMTVYDNGQALYQFPISAGSTKWPTQDGIHIVLDRTSKVQMISSSVGIPVHSAGGYDETVYWDTQISYSGEYVHAAPWSVSEQGLENVSHGCINLSPDRAEAFFHFSRVGDVVDVIDGTRPPLLTDGGVMDWSFPSSEVSWAPAKVGLLTSTVTTLPTTTEPPPPGAPTTVAPLTTLPAGSQVLSGLPGLPVTAVPTTAPATTAPATTAPATTAPATTAPATTAPATTAQPKPGAAPATKAPAAASTGTPTT